MICWRWITPAQRQARRHEPCRLSFCADFVRNQAKFCEIDLARKRRTAGDNKLSLPDVFHVDAVVIIPNTILDGTDSSSKKTRTDRFGNRHVNTPSTFGLVNGEVSTERLAALVHIYARLSHRSMTWFNETRCFPSPVRDRYAAFDCFHATSAIVQEYDGKGIAAAEVGFLSVVGKRLNEPIGFVGINAIGRLPERPRTSSLSAECPSRPHFRMIM